MELGIRLKQARLEAGLSQRQLCGDRVTRNMLSQIEHGTARPSMDTLRYLASRLGKPVSFFLDDDALTSPNAPVILRVRERFDSGDFSGALEALEAYRGPDRLFDREKGLLESLACLGLAEGAIEDGRSLYALELLQKAADAGTASGLPQELERRRLLLLARVKGKALADICALLPSLDAELLLRARAALEQGDSLRAAALLDAAEDQDVPEWNLLRGQAHMARGEFPQAARCLHRVEDAHPETAALLEECYREMEDYKQAYYYARKQKP